MEKLEIRAVIKYFCKECFQRKIKTSWKPLGRSHIEKKWTAEFKRRESVEDDGRTGCPKDAIADEIVKDMHTLVMCDRRRGLRSIASKVGISFREGKINPNDILGVSKIPARWVP